MIVFKDSLYQVADGDLMEPGPYFVSLCVTFKLYTKGSEQFIVSSYTSDDPQFRAISATDTHVRIWGVWDVGYVDVSYKGSEWVTVFVEWSNADEHKGCARIVSEAGTDHRISFTCQTLDPIQPTTVYLGAKSKSGEKPLHGEISALEIYKGEGRVSLPEGISNIMVTDQLMYYPSRKRKAT